MPIALSGSLVISGSITTTGAITMSGSIASASYAATSSYANAFTVANTLTAQTLVVQTITSSIEFVTGSTKNGSTTGNTHQFTGSVLVSGSQTVNGNVTAAALSLSNTDGYLGTINSTAANGAYFAWQTSGTTIADIGTAQQIFGSGGSTTFGLNARGARDLVFGTNNTERMRITSGGDLRVGTTAEPGAGSTTTGASLGNSGFIIGQRNGATVGYFGRGTNDGELFAFYQGSTQNGGIGVASGGIWFGSGTANTERMRITSTGRIIINNSVANDSGDRNLSIQGSLSATLNDVAHIYLTQVWNGVAYPVILAAQQDLSYGNASGAFVLKTSYWNGSSVTTAERLRVNAIGRVGIGITTPGAALQVAYPGVDDQLILGSVANNRDHAMYMCSGPNQAEVFRYQSGTRLMIGVSTSISNIDVLPGGSSGVRISAGNTSWSSYSDERLKNIDSELNNCLQSILDWRVVKYSLKSEQNPKLKIGLVAQEVETDFPEIVDTDKYEDIDDAKTLRYTEVIPILVKAIQELSAENNTLKEILQRNNIQ